MSLERTLRVVAVGILLAVVVGCALRKPLHAQDGTILRNSGDTYVTPPAPALSELEQLKVQNLNLLDELRKAILEADTCRGQIAAPRAQATQQQITAGVQTLQQAIEAAHPGFTWDPASGAFTAKPAEEKKK